MADNFLMRLRKQGSGLHLYFTSEMLRNKSFKLKEGDNVVIILKDNGVDVRKVDISKLI